MHGIMIGQIAMLIQLHLIEGCTLHKQRLFRHHTILLLLGCVTDHTNPPSSAHQSSILLTQPTYTLMPCNATPPDRIPFPSEGSSKGFSHHTFEASTLQNRHPKSQLARIESGQTFSKNIFELIHPETLPFTRIQVAHVPGVQNRPLFAEAVKLPFEDTRVGESFGPSWSTHWFKIQIDIPEEWVGERIDIMWNSSSECLLYTSDGKPLQGFTGIDWQLRDTFCWFYKPLPSDAPRTYELYMEMACNNMFGTGKSDYLTPEDDRYDFTLKMAHIAVRDQEVYDFWIDFRLISDMALNMDQDSQRAADALYVANNIINHYNEEDRKLGRSALKKCQELARAFLSQRSGDSTHRISAVGHAHIDAVWLWNDAETHRKVARTFATQLHLMDMYPSHKFAQSTPFFYMWVQKEYPSLFDRIKEKVKNGQWVLIGGSMLESCGILPSGECFVRQFLYGQRYFLKEFGRAATEAHLPDSFGYSSVLPMIFRSAGISRFVTQKLSWNQYTVFPNSTFHWRGLDGSTVLSHFPPADNYNSEIKISELLFQVKNFKDRNVSKNSLSLFGYGDGGGGPSLDMVARLQEGRLLNTDGMPKMTVAPISEFFEAAEKDDKERGFQTFDGELYLERHRGTYTAQALVKKQNKMCEIALRNLEIFSLLDHHNTYPKEDLYRMWLDQILLTFHDSLPGSSIGLVYKDVHRIHAEVLKKSGEFIDRSLKSIAQQAVGGSGTDNSAALVINSLGWPRAEIVELPSDDNLHSIQTSYNGRPLGMVSVPSLGMCVNTSSQWNIKFTESHLSIKETSESIIMSNHLIQATVSKKHGTLQIFDSRSGVERVTVTKGNQFVIYDNITTNYDAWEVQQFSLSKFEILNDRVTKIEIVESGPLRVALQLHLQLSDTSELRQIISLTPLSSQLTFDTEVDWLQEKHVHLKVKFETDMRNEFATYGTQFGTIRRPTHYNTAADAARFEVCGHGFADLSEYNYGVALTSDCKYGWSVFEKDMYISLLRAPKQPDDQCDMMKGHKFVYTAYPHVGSFQEARVIQKSLELQTPLHVLPVPEKELSVECLSVSSPAVILESIKQSEDSKDAIIIRLWESFGSHAKFSLHLRSPLVNPSSVKAVLMVNILENKYEGAATFEVQGDALVVSDLSLTPFKMMSLKVF